MRWSKWLKGILIIVFLFLGSLITNERINAENWIRFTNKQLDGSYFAYDQDSLTKLSSTTMLVWEKRITPSKEKSRESKKNGGSIKMRFWEINCEKRTGKLLSIKEYDQDENLLSSLNTIESAKPEFIPPRSMGEALYKAICPKSKK